MPAALVWSLATAKWKLMSALLAAYCFPHVITVPALPRSVTETGWCDCFRFWGCPKWRNPNVRMSCNPHCKPSFGKVDHFDPAQMPCWAWRPRPLMRSGAASRVGFQKVWRCCMWVLRSQNPSRQVREPWVHQRFFGWLKSWSFEWLVELSRKGFEPLQRG